MYTHIYIYPNKNLMKPSRVFTDKACARRGTEIPEACGLIEC